MRNGVPILGVIKVEFKIKEVCSVEYILLTFSSLCFDTILKSIVFSRCVSKSLVGTPSPLTHCLKRDSEVTNGIIEKE